VVRASASFLVNLGSISWPSQIKRLKVGIYSFPVWRSALKRDSVKLGRQVRLLCTWARHLTGLPSYYLWVVRLVVAGWQLDSEDRKDPIAVSWSEVPW